MKSKASKIVDVVIYSINYILINYALANMAMLLKSNPLFILFFASEVWVMGNYWGKMHDLTGSKILSVILLFGCFAIHIGIAYFVGRVVGNIVPFRQG